DDLGDEPPRFNIAANDAAHDEAHTGDHHGPQIPLQHIPGVKTIEGRIYGGHGWAEHKNGSFKWDNFAIMHRTISDYVNEHWELIRTNLAMNGRHRAVFDAGHRVGEGFVNRGMGGAGPRQAQYMTTSVVRILIRVVPGSDPPEPFIVTAFPAGLG
ncbi:MAG TPA: hypothetical protein VFW27_31285, partial [Actinoplanes sp.]|nr:hypothetical protein [Actinoplanes sp.]